MKIWLDDVRDAPDDSWICLRTGRALAGMLLIHQEEIEEISFDHDLGDWDGDVELTGYVWLCQIEAMVENGTLTKIPKLSIHSANPAVYTKMAQAIQSIERMVDGKN
jgi:hypothetical protein